MIRFGAAQFAALAVAAPIAVAANATPPSYTLTPLGLSDSTTTPCGSSDLLTPSARGINEAAEVTGYYCRRTVVGGSPLESVRGFRWRSGGIVDLGVPAGFPDDPTIVIQPAGINAVGDVVGQVANQNGASSAFLWNGSRMTAIVNQATAHAVNNPEQVTGELFNLTGTHAFLYSHGAVTDLGTVPGAISSQAYAMNNMGHIAANALIPTVPPHYYYAPLILWTGAQWRNLGILTGDFEARPNGTLTRAFSKANPRWNTSPVKTGLRNSACGSV